jgi:hypothetical protein
LRPGAVQAGADALRDDRALELGEHSEHLQQRPAGRCRSVDAPVMHHVELMAAPAPHNRPNGSCCRERVEFPGSKGGTALAGDRVQRRLTASLAADIAGYGRLMGADEEGTLVTIQTRIELAAALGTGLPK